MTASRFWVGIEFMPASFVQAAASHPRPILCGQIAEAAAMRSALSNRLDQAEWHDMALASPIGQGHLLDLLRQRGPIEHIFLALPAISCPSAEPAGDAPRPLDEVLSETRHAVEGFIAVLRGAEAALDGAIGAGLTLLRVDPAGCSSPTVHALAAFVDEWIARETERWAAQGLSLAQLTVESVDQ